jgi:cysteine-rich repeat protein
MYHIEPASNQRRSPTRLRAWAPRARVYDDARLMRSSPCIVRCAVVGCALAVTAAAAGCSKLVGLGDITYVDAPPGAEPACPVAPPNTVIACAIITHVRADGTTFTTRRDLRSFTVAAYITDASKAGFRIVSGTVSSEGIARIENVPDGTPYYFRIQNPQDPTYPWPHYFFTDKHDLEIGNAEMGRDDSPTTSATAVTLNLAGMTPWKAGDAAQLVSFETGTQVPVITQSSLIPVGATTLMAGVDWNQGLVEATFSDFTDAAARVPQLIDQSAQRNDDLWALHVTTTTASDNTLHPFIVSTIVDAANLTGVTLGNGKPTTINGAFQPVVPATTPLLFSVATSAIRNAFRDANRYYNEDIRCELYPTPAAAHGLVMGYSALAAIAATEIVATSTGIINHPIMYANPFPASMQPLMHCSIGHTRRAMVPGTTRFSSGFSYISSYTPLPASGNFTFMPPLHTVTNLKIGGVDGLGAGAVPFDGESPVTMSWDPVPGVTHYQVRVKDETRNTFLGVFDTTQSSVVLPADTFTRGNFYVFRVFAIQTSGAYVDGKLLDFQAPLWSARISTGMFRFSDLCGNGLVDPPEECDPGTNGKTASCDPDCSITVCGDGLLNDLAGEACDDTVESPRCNGGATCTAPRCGDAIHNRLAGEECDDGNLVNSDGCSAQCKLELCGNNVVNPGEDCDDANRTNGDGCDAFCKTEPPPF